MNKIKRDIMRDLRARNCAANKRNATVMLAT